VAAAIGADAPAGGATGLAPAIAWCPGTVCGRVKTKYIAIMTTMNQPSGRTSVMICAPSG
jgi:hypothetical protein